MLRRSTNLIIASFILDLLSILVAAGLASWLRVNLHFGRALSIDSGWKILLSEAVLLYPIIFLLFTLYDPEHIFRASDEYQILIGACLIGALALAGLIYFTARDISRLYLVYFYLLHFIFVTTWRGVDRLVRRNHNARGLSLRRVLLIGGGEAACQALERLHNLAWAGVQLVGYLTDGDRIPSANGEIPHLGKLSDAEQVVSDQVIDDVLIAIPAESYNSVRYLMPNLVDQPCNIWVVPDYFSLLIYGARVADLGDIAMISLKAPTISGYQRLVKRCFDLTVGTLSLLVAAPFMGFIALAIKLDSPGSVLFRQPRVGENGKIFSMYKFRSMVSGADTQLNTLIMPDENGNLVHKRPNDPRVTRVGRFIRRNSLDELPQFFNVLKGEMSLVGPRPELPIFVEQYEPWQHKRLGVPQGITGWWQVNGRSDKPMHLNTDQDLYYVQNYSLLLDIQILIKTVSAVLSRKGAY